MTATASAAASFAILLAACSSPPRSWVRTGPPPITTETAPAAEAHDPAPAAALVEQHFRQRGLHFGTDGSVGAIYSYLRDRQTPVPPTDARASDVVFFDLGREWQGCGSHAGIVEEVDRGGRVTFREVRGGTVRHSHADPGHPYRRRDDSGRIVNTFMRPIRPGDPPGTRYTAGHMLCAVFKVDHPQPNQGEKRP